MLVLFADGEAGRDEAKIREHLAACWSCRLRMRELDEAATEFARIHRDPDQELPSPEGPRSLLKARLRELAMANRPSDMRSWLGNRTAVQSAVCFALVFVIATVAWLVEGPSERKAIP